MHYTFEKLWIDQMKKDKMYLWLILDSFVSASHSRDVDDWIARAPEMSLRTQGWLDKASCPILAINGARDTWITIEDTHLLYETGDPKAIRVYSNRFHMALEDPTSRPLIVQWLKEQLR